MEIIKKSFLALVVFCNLFTTLQSSQGSFKQNFTVKPIKISLQSHQFLKNNIILQNFLISRAACHQELASCVQSVQSMLQLQKLIYHCGEITPENMQNLFAILNKVKKIFIENNIVFDCAAKDQAWNLWWSYLQQSLDVMQLRGYEKDVTWLREQIAQGKIMSSVIACIDLMHHFNGLLVTDYDLLVLANLVVALLVMQC